MIIILFLCLTSAILTAPPNNSIVIFASERVNPYNAILKACYQIESSSGRDTLNVAENAVGGFGIRPIRLLDYNQRTGKHITLNDCYNYETSKMIFLYYVSQCDYRDIKGMAVAWNGVSKENKYYAKIKKLL